MDVFVRFCNQSLQQITCFVANGETDIRELFVCVIERLKVNIVFFLPFRYELFLNPIDFSACTHEKCLALSFNRES